MQEAVQEVSSVLSVKETAERLGVTGPSQAHRRRPEDESSRACMVLGCAVYCARGRLDRRGRVGVRVDSVTEQNTAFGRS